jgi:hypothetical protein
LWYLIKVCIPISVLDLLGILYQRLSLIIILSLSGTVPTRYYFVAACVVKVGEIGLIAVFTAFCPLLAQVVAIGKSN